MKIAALIRENAGEFGQIDTLDHGSPTKTAAFTAPCVTADRFEWAAYNARSLMGHTIPSKSRRTGISSARTGRGRCSYHALEFPSSDDCIRSWLRPLHSAIPASSNRRVSIPSPLLSLPNYWRNWTCLPAQSMSSPAPAAQWVKRWLLTAVLIWYRFTGSCETGKVIMAWPAKP